MDVSAPRRLSPRPGRRALVLVAVIIAALLGVTATARAATCDETWTGAQSSEWGVAGNWSPAAVPGAPSTTQNVCLPSGAANYPVHLDAWTYQDPASGETFVQHGATVNNLSIASGAGLVVDGESFVDRGDGYQTITLTVNGTGSIAAGSSLELLTSDAGVVTPEQGHGGNAVLAGSGTVTNSGTFSSVSTSTQSSASNVPFYNQLDTNFVNAAGATVGSGFLEITGGPTVTNQGNWTVAAGSGVTINSNDLQTGPSTFANQGTYANNGSTAIGADREEKPDVFSQAGPETGNPVQIQQSAELNDSSGPGSFLFNDSNADLAGTIPAGQTVTVQAANNGNGYETDVQLEGSQVINQGSLDIDDPNVSSDTATGIQFFGGTLVNQGTVTATGEAPHLDSQLNVAFTNAHGATLAVPTGELNFQGGGTVTNDGGVTVGPGAELLVNSNPFLSGPETFVNAADGTLTPQIASPTSFGTINAGGNLKFQVGGTLAPALVGGYTPALGTSFAVLPIHDAGVATGTFAALAPGFSANYGAEASSSGPNQISVVWGGLPATPGAGTGSGGGTTTKAPTLRASLKVSGDTVSLRLTCPKGASCPKAQVAETVREIVRGHHVVGLAGAHTRLHKGEKAHTVTVGHTSALVKAGHSVTVRVSLDAAGRALLRRFHALPVKITVRSGKAHRSLGATLHPAAKKKHHR